MNEKQIELLKKEIEFLEDKIKKINEISDYLYKNNYDEDIRNVFQSSYDLEQLKNKLKKQLELYQMLSDKGIDTSNRYYLTDDIYLSLSDLKPYFYIDNSTWIYDNYINSWSGINEWITDLIDQEYSLFSCNSYYCHAFGTRSLKDIFAMIEVKVSENSTKAKLIENLVEFTKEDGKFKELRDQVVKMINFKLNAMREYLKE